MEKISIIKGLLSGFAILVAFIFGAKTAPPKNQETLLLDRAEKPVSLGQQREISNGRKVFTNRALGKQAYSETQGALLADIMSEGDFLARKQRLLTLIDQLRPGDFPLVFDDFRKLQMGSARLEEYRMLLQAWARIDPLSVLDYTSANPVWPYEEGEIFGTWAQSDPEAAIAYARRLRPDATVLPWAQNIISAIAPNDPTLATKMLEELPDRDTKVRLMDVIGPHIARKGFEETSAWLEGLNVEGHVKNAAKNDVILELIRTNPEQTMSWLLDSGEGRSKDSDISMGLQFWSENDLDGALSWMASNPGIARAEASKSVLPAFVKQDAAGAAVWVDSFAGEPHYDDLVSQFVSSARRKNYEIVLPYISQIPEREQYYTYSSMFSYWVNTDRDSARRQLDSPKIPDSIRTRILSIYFTE